MNRPTFRASLHFSMEPHGRFNAAVYIQHPPPSDTVYRSHCVDGVALSAWKALYAEVYIFKSSRYASAEHVSSSSTMRTRNVRFGLALCRGESSSPRRHVGEIRPRKSDSERAAHVVGIVAFRQRVSCQTRHVRVLWQTEWSTLWKSTNDGNQIR